MTTLQEAVLEALADGDLRTADEICEVINANTIPRTTVRGVINALCYLRGDGYVTDGRSAIAYESGIETWRTPPEFDWHVEGGKMFWKKLPSRFAASPPDIQEKFK